MADYNVVISEAMPGTEKYEDFWAFFSDRLEEPAVKEWKKRKASYVKKKQKEKNGKLLASLTKLVPRSGTSGRSSEFGGHRLQAATGAIG